MYYQLLILLFVISSCKHAGFEGRNGKKAVDTPIVEKNEEIVVPESDKSGDDSIVVEDKESNDEVDVDEDEQDKGEVKVPAPKPADAYFNLNLKHVKHDSLYLNCLYVDTGSGFEKVVCNKDFETLNEVFTFGPYKSGSCIDIQVQIKTFEPKYEKECIKKIQANRDYHECQYKDEAMMTTHLGQSQRFLFQGENPDHFQVSFEDRQDWDYNDFRFEVSLEEVKSYKLANVSTCG